MKCARCTKKVAEFTIEFAAQENVIVVLCRHCVMITVNEAEIDKLKRIPT